MGLGDHMGGRTPHSNYLPSVKPNQQLTPAFVSKIIQGIDNSTPRFGNGYQLSNYAGGTCLRINTPSSAGPAPFNFQVSGFIANNKAYASVSVGTVNRAIPRINGKYLDSVVNDNPPLLTVTGNSGYVVIEATAEANKPFPSILEIKYSPSIPADTSDKSYYPLASIVGIPPKQGVEASIVVNQIHMSGNLGVNRFKVAQSLMYFQWYTV